MHISVTLGLPPNQWESVVRSYKKSSDSLSHLAVSGGFYLTLARWRCIKQYKENWAEIYFLFFRSSITGCRSDKKTSPFFFRRDLLVSGRTDLLVSTEPRDALHTTQYNNNLSMYTLFYTRKYPQFDKWDNGALMTAVTNWYTNVNYKFLKETYCQLLSHAQ